MIGTPEQAAGWICPVIAAGTGKQTKCQGPRCAWWTWHVGPGVKARNFHAETSQAVGGCAAIGEPSSAHLQIALGRHLTRVGKVLNAPRYDASKINSQTPAEAQWPTPAPPLDDFLQRHITADSLSHVKPEPTEPVPADHF